jgi:hypothetical protein
LSPACSIMNSPRSSLNRLRTFNLSGYKSTTEIFHSRTIYFRGMAHGLED